MRLPRPWGGSFQEVMVDWDQPELPGMGPPQEVVVRIRRSFDDRWLVDAWTWPNPLVEWPDDPPDLATGVVTSSHLPHYLKSVATAAMNVLPKRPARRS